MSSPFMPVALRLLERMFSMHFPRRFFVRRKPGKDERQPIAGLNSEFGDGGEILPMRLDRCAQNQCIWTGDRDESSMLLPHPRHNVAVVETDRQLHPHSHTSGDAFDD